MIVKISFIITTGLARNCSFTEKHLFDQERVSYQQYILNGLSSALSQTVANGMKTVIGDEASENVLFVEIMDRFFDCLNVNNFTTGHRKRKLFQDPYRKKDEFRF